MSSINIYIILSILSLFQSALSLPAPTRVSITHDVVSHVLNGSFPTTSLPILHGAEHVNLPSVEIDDKSTEHEDGKSIHLFHYLQQLSNRTYMIIQHWNTDLMIQRSRDKLYEDNINRNEHLFIHFLFFMKTYQEGDIMLTTRCLRLDGIRAMILPNATITEHKRDGEEPLVIPTFN